MILFPPVKFDGNEWFILVTTVVTITFIAFLPRRFTFLTNLLMWMFIYSFAQFTDFVIGKEPLPLYKPNDLNEYEIFDLILYTVTFPAVVYCYYYFLDKWSLKGKRLAIYIVAWSVFSALFEWVSEKYFKVFTWTGWATFLSHFAYIVIFILITIVFFFVQKQQTAEPQ